ncbi:MAG: hypothetical protein ABI200_06010 [Gaiellales bacterium]
MSFYYRVNNAIGRANSALNQLYSYNSYSHPRSEPNASIRNNARLMIDPLVYDLKQAVREGRYQRVPSSNARQALRAADMLQAATWSLSDLPEQGRPTNVSAAQYQIREAINLLNRARW